MKYGKDNIQKLTSSLLKPFGNKLDLVPTYNIIDIPCMNF